ncbi:MAG: LamB/YcsF family protein [Betaproteobacteria bacterium]|nr:LamB/YcsF family protein [Betaproteobacteria bacterium]
MTIVDLNSDMGESFGAWTMGDDASLLEVVSSANIACGFHAGDPSVIRRTVQLAARNGVAIGAHPSLPDLAGFGRRSMAVSAGEVYDLVLYQISALAGFARVAGGRLHHVKAHGALYNMAAGDASLAAAIAAAVRDFDADLVLYGLAGSALIDAGEAAGLSVAAEVFADRSYRKDGSLVPRSQPGAVIDEVASAVAQGLDMVRDQRVLSVEGNWVPLRADTICVHGDTPGAVTLARELRRALATNGIEVRAP